MVDTSRSPNLAPGQRVRWAYGISGIAELTGVVVQHKYNRLWLLKADRGTQHIVGEWIIYPEGK